jgi:L-malate glycosyltransferase
MKNIIWLASWYPNKADPYTGDFIERHARAASLENHIHVLHIVRSNILSFPEKKKTEYKRYPEGGEVTIIYYYSPVYKIRWFDILHSNFRYLKYHISFYKTYIRKRGKPDGLHVHTALKSGMAAILLKILFGSKYVVSEHWSGLCPEAKPNYNDRPFYFRWLWKKVMQNACGFSAVSNYLALAMKTTFPIRNVHVIPNVVDEAVFFPSGKEVTRPRFIHVSTIKNYQKNVGDILKAAVILGRQIPEFSLLIVGNRDESMEIELSRINMNHAVTFVEMCSQETLCTLIQDSIALILYSRFETFGCVVIEANACGKPVIVSDLPVFHENVQTDLNGIFVPLDHPELLANAMFEMVKNFYSYDPVLIRNWTLEHYSFPIVAKLFSEFYNLYFN